MAKVLINPAQTLPLSTNKEPQQKPQQPENKPTTVQEPPKAKDQKIQDKTNNLLPEKPENQK